MNMKLTFITLALISTSAFANITFSRDSRPVDGDLKELKIKNENARHMGSVTLKSAFVNRSTGKNITKTLLSESGLDCTVSNTQVVCSKDLRMVDGAKTEIIVKLNAQKSYDVIKKTSFVSRMTGKESKTSTTLATDLKKI